jgi:hypothetical protein
MFANKLPMAREGGGLWAVIWRDRVSVAYSVEKLD